MIDESLKCAKCGTVMEQGIVLDHTYGGVTKTEWIEGAPKFSWWTGLQVPRDAPHFAVITYRCPKCGYMESYARNAVA
jgi:predicted nucleic-acid-binding Zn-ribbon protein